MVRRAGRAPMVPLRRPRERPGPGRRRHRCRGRRQGLTLAHFTAQLEDLRDTSLTLELNLSTFGTHPRVNFGLCGGQSKLILSGKGQGKLKLSGNGNECKPLVVGGGSGSGSGSGYTFSAAAAAVSSGDVQRRALLQDGNSTGTAAAGDSSAGPRTTRRPFSTPLPLQLRDSERERVYEYDCMTSGEALRVARCSPWRPFIHHIAHRSSPRHVIHRIVSQCSPHHPPHGGPVLTAATTMQCTGARCVIHHVSSNWGRERQTHSCRRCDCGSR